MITNYDSFIYVQCKQSLFTYKYYSLHTVWTKTESNKNFSQNLTLYDKPYELGYGPLINFSGKVET